MALKFENPCRIEPESCKISTFSGGALSRFTPVSTCLVISMTKPLRQYRYTKKPTP